MPELENEHHELFCNYYVNSGNQVKSYMQVFTGCTYDSAKSQGHMLYKRPEIKARVAELKDEITAELKEQYKQTREQTIKDLLTASEEAKAAGAFAAYAKLREMIIRMCGFYAPDEVNINNNVAWSLKFPGLDEDSKTGISIEGKILPRLDESDDSEDEEFDETV